MSYPRPYNECPRLYNECLGSYNECLKPYNECLGPYNECLKTYNECLGPYNEYTTQEYTCDGICIKKYRVFNTIYTNLHDSPGKKGPIGDQGPIGPSTHPGEKGPDGIMGEIGPQGAQGPDGTVDHVGIAGPKGSQGEQGDQGSTGEMGDPGPDGTVDHIGPQGPQGPPGQPGISNVQLKSGLIQDFGVDITLGVYINPGGIKLKYFKYYNTLMIEGEIFFENQDVSSEIILNINLGFLFNGAPEHRGITTVYIPGFGTQLGGYAMINSSVNKLTIRWSNPTIDTYPGSKIVFTTWGDVI
jgi:hypothetical protein